MKLALSEDVLGKLKFASTATLTTQLFKRNFRQQFLVGVKPLNPDDCSFVGEAFTLRFIPSREDKDWDLGDLYLRGENNIQWEASERIEAGQVLMIDSRKDARAASAGNMLLTRMMHKGVAGAVTDGAFRDGTEISKMHFPAFCTANTASTRPSHHRAVDMQLPIGCADVAVYPGDIVKGDSDGVVVIPRSVVTEIADDSFEQELREEFLFTKLNTGSPLWGTYPPDEKTLVEYTEWRKKHGR